jgi:hypothetical protein
MKKLCCFLTFSGYDMIFQYAFAAEEITTPDFFSKLFKRILNQIVLPQKGNKAAKRRA